MKPWSIYIHFPYCVRRCAYCDFATTVAREPPREAYREAILAELEQRTAALPRGPIATVFFGGGTPSLWGAQHVGAVLAWLDRWGGLSSDAEVTLEANPGTLEAGDLPAYAAAGVTRVSVGVQALADDRLRALDRAHDAAAAHATLRTLGELLAAGKLASANADLIYGGPGQGVEEAASDVATVLGYGLPHLSAYALTVETGTPLAERVHRGLQQAPDEDLLADILHALPAWTATCGLARYEVSNFARPGHACRHNLAYWQGHHYLAVGVGAHGFVPAEGMAGLRYGNSRDHRRWFEGVRSGTLAEDLREPIDADCHLTERLLTGLRLTDGLDLAALAADVGRQRVERLRARAAQVIAAGEPVALVDHHLRVQPNAWHRLDGLVLALA
jgi:oxygen-independent coproporphyrinogen-3 oxidase